MTPIATLSESRLSDSADVELDGYYLYRVGNALLNNDELADLDGYYYKHSYYNSDYNVDSNL